MRQTLATIKTSPAVVAGSQAAMAAAARRLKEPLARKPQALATPLAVPTPAVQKGCRDPWPSVIETLRHFPARSLYEKGTFSV